uniref:Uncharacterized protein n=1 Tax=Astyanax mexicanus TaxID=7994 RepID=A0A8B9JB03_ASTMX
CVTFVLLAPVTTTPQPPGPHLPRALVIPFISTPLFPSLCGRAHASSDTCEVSHPFFRAVADESLPEQPVRSEESTAASIMGNNLRKNLVAVLQLVIHSLCKILVCE